MFPGRSADMAFGRSGRDRGQKDERAMTFNPSRAERRAVHEENKRWPLELTPVPRGDWPLWRNNTPLPIEVWRSRGFLVQIFQDGGNERITINRTTHDGQGWGANLTWDEMQRLKSECGRSNRWAVEVFPPSDEVVNVANMRHLWLLPGIPPYGWSRHRE